VIYENIFIFLSADGSRGGILIATKDATFQILNPVMTSHTISITILDVRINISWTFTCVYDAQGDLEKKYSLERSSNLINRSCQDGL
jgi:hypothetical protein